jgi:hypothetical protein
LRLRVGDFRILYEGLRCGPSRLDPWSLLSRKELEEWLRQRR